VTDGLLIATTLPAHLFPKAGGIFSEAPETEIAFRRSSGEVLWRVPGVITESASVNVSLCVLTPFSTTEVLTYTTLFQDVFTQKPPHVYTQTISTEQTRTIAPSCTLTDTQHPWSATVFPIYPTQIVTNQAWIYSNELGFWKPSEETVVTRYWPSRYFYH
jgi:hypothetical protein